MAPQIKPGTENDDAPWKSTPGAKKASFLVKSKIKGQVQGQDLKTGTVVSLELTDDIRELVRPGVLEPIEGLQAEPTLDETPGERKQRLQRELAEVDADLEAKKAADAKKAGQGS